MPVWGLLAPLIWTVGDTVALIECVATVLGVGLAYWVYFMARGAIIRHVWSHLDIVSDWAKGPNGNGWSVGDLTPARQLTWMHPRNVQAPLASAPAAAEITLLQGAFVPFPVARQLVALAQSIATFNMFIERVHAVQLAKVDSMTKVGMVLDNALKRTRPDSDGEVPDDLAPDELARIEAHCRNSSLTEAEIQWMFHLRGLLIEAHLDLIGTRDGRGICFQLHELVRVLDRARLRRPREKARRPVQ